MTGSQDSVYVCLALMEHNAETFVLLVALELDVNISVRVRGTTRRNVVLILAPASVTRDIKEKLVMR